MRAVHCLLSTVPGLLFHNRELIDFPSNFKITWCPDGVWRFRISNQFVFMGTATTLLTNWIYSTFNNCFLFLYSFMFWKLIIIIVIGASVKFSIEINFMFFLCFSFYLFLFCCFLLLYAYYCNILNHWIIDFLEKVRGDQLHDWENKLEIVILYR